MQNVVSVWTSLDARRRVIVILATIAVFAAVLLLSRMAAQPSMSLLYAGLEQPASGEVINALEQRGEIYEVRGGAIYVASAQRDQLRMTLASEGLPAAGAAGYELLDNMSGFGTTSQMFDAAYWRAKEGELARTILSSPLVRAARVHISNPSQQVFQRGQAASGSVFITPANGSVSGPQARAFAFLVASAVTGLSAENVSVIDASTGSVIAADDTAASGAQNGLDRAVEMKAAVQRIMEAYVGVGKAVVEVNIETETARESLTERIFDSEGRVAISSETEERTNNSKGAPNANVTVASNLPDGDANAQAGQSSTQTSETRERQNYEIPETLREIVRAPGDIKRLNVAVLVDGETTIAEDGTSTWSPRSEADLEDLRQLVSSAVGLNEERGDTLTIKSMQFMPVPPLGTAAEPSLLQTLNLDVTKLVQIAILGLVALAISMFVIRPILSRPPLAAENTALLGADGQAEGDADTIALPGALDTSLPDLGGSGDFDFDFGDGAGMGEFGGVESEDPVERLRSMIENRQSETVEVLRGWMEADKERA